MVSNGEQQVEDDLRNEFEAWAALAHGSTYVTFLCNCRDTDSYASDQAHYDYIAFRGGWLSALGCGVDNAVTNSNKEDE